MRRRNRRPAVRAKRRRRQRPIPRVYGRSRLRERAREASAGFRDPGCWCKTPRQHRQRQPRAPKRRSRPRTHRRSNASLVRGSEAEPPTRADRRAQVDPSDIVTVAEPPTRGSPEGRGATVQAGRGGAAHARIAVSADGPSRCWTRRASARGLPCRSPRRWPRAEAAALHARLAVARRSRRLD